MWMWSSLVLEWYHVLMRLTQSSRPWCELCWRRQWKVPRVWLWVLSWPWDVLVSPLQPGIRFDVLWVRSLVVSRMSVALQGRWRDTTMLLERSARVDKPRTRCLRTWRTLLALCTKRVRMERYNKLWLRYVEPGSNAFATWIPPRNCLDGWLSLWICYWNQSISKTILWDRWHSNWIPILLTKARWGSRTWLPQDSTCALLRRRERVWRRVQLPNALGH